MLVDSTLRVDTVRAETLKVDSIPHAWLDALAQDRDFYYGITVKSETLWEKFVRWLSSVLDTSVENGAKVADVTTWIVLGGLLLAIMLIVLNRSRRGINREVAVRGEATSVEDLDEEDLDRIIGQEIAAQRWRSAIRYLYLRSLNDLQSVGTITWKKNKTNRDYLNEITAPTMRNVFQEAVNVFERVWYGDAQISEADFHRARPVYDAVRNSTRKA